MATECDRFESLLGHALRWSLGCPAPRRLRNAVGSSAPICGAKGVRMRRSRPTAGGHGAGIWIDPGYAQRTSLRARAQIDGSKLVLRGLIGNSAVGGRADCRTGQCICAWHSVVLHCRGQGFNTSLVCPLQRSVLPLVCEWLDGVRCCLMFGTTPSRLKSGGSWLTECRSMVCWPLRYDGLIGTRWTLQTVGAGRGQLQKSG